MLHLPGPLPEPEAAAMPALLLHGAVHGGARGLRKETSKAARWLKRLKPMQHFLLRLRGHPRPCIMHPESALRKWRALEVYSTRHARDLDPCKEMRQIDYLILRGMRQEAGAI